MWIDPVLFKLGALEIRYYGLVYVVGFFLSVWWMFYLRKRRRLELSKEEIWDFMFWLMLGVLIGSRLFMIFWEPGIFLLKPWELLKIWQGGMSFHGGLSGAVLTSLWWCRKKKINFWRLADMLVVPAVFALALGRIANFINGELVGRICDGRWCINFPGYSGYRHPSTLYASGKRFLVFFWLVWLSFWKEFKPGFIFWNFVFFEGFGRILVDFYREDILYFGFSLGQWFSLAMVVVAFAVFVKFYREDWKKVFWKSSN
jgi:phosphatidylglycerol:prolipoprotein diacylglycerol transferase